VGVLEQALRLEKHYSGGNLTQMGVFSMFYGLYGNYWFPMHAARRAPVLMDVMQQQDYQFSLYTSQRFTYPAFDKTVFANMQARRTCMPSPLGARLAARPEEHRRHARLHRPARQGRPS
jgi:membrane-anchored protein YejM (alkaline phosphatase superfamily)